MKQRIYINTFMVGGYFDKEFKEATGLLFNRLEANEVIFVLSDLLDLELLNAPTHVRNHLLQYSADKFERIGLIEEAVELADAYIRGYLSLGCIGTIVFGQGIDPGGWWGHYQSGAK